MPQCSSTGVLGISKQALQAEVPAENKARQHLCNAQHGERFLPQSSRCRRLHNCAFILKVATSQAGYNAPASATVCACACEPIYIVQVDVTQRHQPRVRPLVPVTTADTGPGSSTTANTQHLFPKHNHNMTSTVCQLTRSAPLLYSSSFAQHSLQTIATRPQSDHNAAVSAPGAHTHDATRLLCALGIHATAVGLWVGQQHT
jgi:hypothetical protein